MKLKCTMEHQHTGSFSVMYGPPASGKTSTVKRDIMGSSERVCIYDMHDEYGYIDGMAEVTSHDTSAIDTRCVRIVPRKPSVNSTYDIKGDVRQAVYGFRSGKLVVEDFHSIFNPSEESMWMQLFSDAKQKNVDVLVVTRSIENMYGLLNMADRVIFK